MNRPALRGNTDASGSGGFPRPFSHLRALGGMISAAREGNRDRRRIGEKAKNPYVFLR
jgi:hypothetical protein